MAAISASLKVAAGASVVTAAMAFRSSSLTMSPMAMELLDLLPLTVAE